MKKCIIVIMLLCAYAMAQNMIVRVYARSWDDLCRISPKRNLDIAGAHGGEWYDIVADQAVFNKIVSSGLSYEVVVHDLAVTKEAARASYLSYTETNDSLRQMVTNYPSLAALDSLPITTYEGRWIYGIKISDNPYVEEDDEPGFLIDGCHHSREWACVPTVLFFADSILTAYGSVSQITDIINTTEIYCFPIINVDGYVYDYPGGYMWRKNREPFHGYIGTDPNRNYAGCAPDIEGDWGAVDEGQATHYPNSSTFCGAYANSGDETRALTMYVAEHTCNANMSYHSYGELLMWPYGWTGAPTPDDVVYARAGNRMADMIEKLSSGTYDRGPVYSAIYPVSGSSMDWFYSYTHWVQGISNLSYTTELGTSFYQPQSDLEHIIHENFDALLYLADFCDSIMILTTGVVAPPHIYPEDTVGTDFVLYWHPVNSAENDPLHWELVELSNPSVIEDDLESGTGRWLFDGFTLSSTRAHSGVYSYFSGNTHQMNHAVRTAQPYLVQPGDSVTFWCWYDLEYEYDVAVVEVSENTKLWFNLDTTRFNGTQTSWTRYAYSLEDWVGKSIYIRFRSMTDSYTLGSGFYVDDIYPAVQFSNVDTIASSIADTSYSFTGHSEGDYYYYVRGYNSAWGWGDYSCLEDVSVIASVPPEAPYIYCTKSGSDIEIAWAPVTTDTLGSPAIISHYAVYRDTSPSFDVTTVDSIGFVVPPDTDYTDIGAQNVSDCCYYLVKAVAAGGLESKKSNMGYKFNRFFNHNASTTDKNLVALPWHSGYTTVSDLTDDLSVNGDPLIKVTNLVPETQTYESWLWDDLFLEWTGTNFDIIAPRAYEMITVQDTALFLVGSNDPDGLVPLNHNSGMTSHNWIGFPYNAIYSTVSDIADNHSPTGDPINKITRMRDDQFYESWIWDDLFMEWFGTNFSIFPAHGLNLVAVGDSFLDPIEYDNGPSTKHEFTAARRGNVNLQLGQLTEPNRAPIWTVHSAPAWAREPGVSHTVTVRLDADGYDDIIFTAYRPDMPYDVLTEEMIGSGIAIKGEQALLWFDVGNFQQPWQDGEELIVIIEAMKDGHGHYAVVDCVLDARRDVQEFAHMNLVPIPDRQDHVIGYSLYKDGVRLNGEVLKSYDQTSDMVVRAVMRGGYETVYGSHGMQGSQKTLPIAYAFSVAPNPFTQSTSFAYALPEVSSIELSIYDVSGRQVAILASGQCRPGYYSIVWQGRDDAGRSVSAGVYFARFDSPEYTTQEKLLLVR